jgi:hypothetical protein
MRKFCTDLKFRQFVIDFEQFFVTFDQFSAILTIFINFDQFSAVSTNLWQCSVRLYILGLSYFQLGNATISQQ